MSNPSTYYGPGSISRNSLVADGCIIEGEVENSILFRGVHVEKGAKVQNCILMQGSVIHQARCSSTPSPTRTCRSTPGGCSWATRPIPWPIAKNAVYSILK